jgi:hypothetical protein
VEILKLKILVSAFRKNAAKAPMTTAALNRTVRGTTESGLAILSRGRKLFMKSPNSITKAMLNPAERSTVSKKLSLVIFSNLIIMKPGTKVKYTNPIIGLATGMFRITVMPITNCKNSTVAKKSIDL